MVDGVEWLFQKTYVKSGKGGKNNKKCIIFYNDLTEKQEESILKTKEEEEPFLVVFRRKNVFYSSYIIGDRNVIYTEANNMAHSLILLAGVYKVADIEVPKTYSMFISLLYTLIFGLPYTNKDTKQLSAYLQIKQQIENEMERGNISRCKGKQK